MTLPEYGESSRRLLREFESLAAELSGHFTRTDAAQSAAAYLRALLSGVERKTSWQMAEAEGLAAPYAFQHLLRRALWDQDAVRDAHQARIKGALGERGILILDETGFLKKGEKSAGVARQYSGTAGKIENSQIGVFAAWATVKGHVLIDRALYLPEDWIKDQERCREAGIPEDIPFLTKPRLAERMIRRALEAGFNPEWVTADEAYGHDGKLRLWLEELRQPYVLAVPSSEYAARDSGKVKVSALCEGLPKKAWQKLSAGKGSKGPRLYDWAWTEVNHPCEEGWCRRVLFRRSISSPEEVSFYLVFAPQSATLKEAAEAAGSRWRIEECFESAKGEVGLDHYEVRSWTGWHRHITLAMIAHAALVTSRAKVFPAPEEAPTGARRKRSSLAAYKKRQRQWSR
jgi:SRSO17 transposase